MTLETLIKNSNNLLETNIELEGYLTQGRRKHSSFLFFDLRDNFTEDENEPKIQLVLKEWEIDDFKHVQKSVVVGDLVKVTGKLVPVSAKRPYEVIVKTIKKVN